MNQEQQTECSDFCCVTYAECVGLYLSLRNKGGSLSAFDLQILDHWQSQGLDPGFIASVLFDCAEECRLHKGVFPRSLKIFNHHIQSVLLALQEV